jgi:hypothetical protein
MSRILRVDQDNYRLAVKTGGTITFDTGPTAGTVVITGNLDVKGTTTTVESTNTTITDNIIQVNYNPNPSSSGISGALQMPYQAGLQIGRGLAPDAFLVYDEQVTHWDSTLNAGAGASTSGSFVLKTYSGSITGTTGLQVNSIAPIINNSLYLDMQGGTGVLTVVNSPNYYTRVVNDNDIPNKQFVTNYVTAQLANAGTEKISKIQSSITQSQVVATVSSIDSYTIDISSGNLILRTQLTSAGLTINTTAGLPGVNILGNTITNSGTGNLILTSGNGVVEVNASMELDVQVSDPATAASKVKFYSKSTEGPGRTGIYFVSNNAYGALAYNQDELVSKNRAVLLSILL